MFSRQITALIALVALVGCLATGVLADQFFGGIAGQLGKRFVDINDFGSGWVDRIGFRDNDNVVRGIDDLPKIEVKAFHGRGPAGVHYRCRG